MPKHFCITIKYFNPRSHERSDDCRSRRKVLLSISIHAPTRGATGVSMSPACFALFQSTLPREERPFHARSVRWSLPISIHAPTRGATCRCGCALVPISISIHAPTRGATSMCILSPPMLHISIHAPTRGATHLFRLSPTSYIFQSTLPREERRKL